MRKVKNIAIVFCMTLILSACFEDRKIVFEEYQVEFESAVMLARATTDNFPIINLTRTSGTPNYLINLIGPQLENAETITYSLEEVPDRLLNATTIKAQQGVHFTLNGNSLSFPANTSVTNFSGLSVSPGFAAQPGVFALLIVRLDGSEKVKPSENYRRLAFRISLN